MSVEKSILNSIEKNGFPEKMVNLPFQAIFNTCKKNGVKLSAVLKNLEKQEVFNEIGTDKILFCREKLAVIEALDVVVIVVAAEFTSAMPAVSPLQLEN